MSRRARWSELGGAGAHPVCVCVCVRGVRGGQRRVCDSEHAAKTDAMQSAIPPPPILGTPPAHLLATSLPLPRLSAGDAAWLDAWLPRRIAPASHSEIAFLQYTSGSTGGGFIPGGGGAAEYRRGRGIPGGGNTGGGIPEGREGGTGEGERATPEGVRGNT